MTLAELAREGPRSLDAAKNCCHHVDAPGRCNCPGALEWGRLPEVAVLNGAVFNGAAAVVPQAAIRAPANMTAAPDARGLFGPRGCWRAWVEVGVVRRPGTLWGAVCSWTCTELSIEPICARLTRCAGSTGHFRRTKCDISARAMVPGNGSIFKPCGCRLHGDGVAAHRPAQGGVEGVGGEHAHIAAVLGDGYPGGVVLEHLGEGAFE